MKKDNVIRFKRPVEKAGDVLTEILRSGAQQLLANAVEAEVTEFLKEHRELEETSGCQRFVRNGYLPERQIQTGIGSVEVKMPRVRDRSKIIDGVRFSSTIIPSYLRKTKRLEEFLPLLYLKGISTGSFSEALEVLIGESARGFSPNVISRLKMGWEEEYDSWRQRDLSSKHYVYWWADGIYVGARLESDKQCLLILMGVNEEGKKELIAIEEGYRESKESWMSLINDLKRRGLKQAPHNATGDGALGFWSALSEVYPVTKQQRCWVHKTVNILDKLPKSLQSKAKSSLQDIWMAEDKTNAKKAFDNFIKDYEAKYPKAVECLKKDREELLTFYSFPAEHWTHLRTTNPIESTFATVRLRTKRARGCFSRTTILTMVFKLCQSAEKKWQRIRKPEHLADVINNAKFIDGIKWQEKLAA
jgi:putative transposase